MRIVKAWHRRFAVAGAFALSAGSAGSSAPADPAEQLRLDQIQVVGTHNSYALPIDRRVVALAGPKLRAMKEAMAGKLSLIIACAAVIGKSNCTNQ